ncbi:MAG: nucleotidyltransferase family protein [Elusimicrobia bacterium]|nr:nucleotidyltransferase family protein [Elusimicrobiota bacterium]
MSREKILESIQKNRKEIRRFGVRRLGLFGSFARGRPARSSDIDFVVEFEKKSFDSYMELKDYLEHLFHRPVDLVLTDAIKPRLRSEILSHSVYVQGL